MLVLSSLVDQPKLAITRSECAVLCPTDRTSLRRITTTQNGKKSVDSWGVLSVRLAIRLERRSQIAFESCKIPIHLLHLPHLFQALLPNINLLLKADSFSIFYLAMLAQQAEYVITVSAECVQMVNDLLTTFIPLLWLMSVYKSRPLELQDLGETELRGLWRILTSTITCTSAQQTSRPVYLLPSPSLPVDFGSMFIKFQLIANEVSRIVSSVQTVKNGITYLLCISLRQQGMCLCSSPLSSLC